MEQFTQFHGCEKYEPFDVSKALIYKGSMGHRKKVLGSIREAIEKTGLKDGMTVSFHHHFRNGDYIVNMVMEEIAKMGIKNLTVAASSLASCHAPRVGHIQNGVVTHI